MGLGPHGTRDGYPDGTAQLNLSNGTWQWDQHLNRPNMGHGTDQWGSVNGIWWMETETYWTAVLSSTLFKDGCQSWDPRHFKNGASRWEKDGEKDGRNWNGKKMGEKMGPTWRKLRSKAITKKFLTLYLGIVVVAFMHSRLFPVLVLVCKSAIVRCGPPWSVLFHIAVR